MDKVHELLKRVCNGRARSWAALDQLNTAIREGAKVRRHLAHLRKCVDEVGPLIGELELLVADRQGPKVDALFQPEDGGPLVTLAIPKRIFDDLEGRFQKIKKAQEAIGESLPPTVRFRIEEPAPGYIVFRS